MSDPRYPQGWVATTKSVLLFEWPHFRQNRHCLLSSGRILVLNITAVATSILQWRYYSHANLRNEVSNFCLFCVQTWVTLLSLFQWSPRISASISVVWQCKRNPDVFSICFPYFFYKEGQETGSQNFIIKYFFDLCTFHDKMWVSMSLNILFLSKRSG